TRLLRALADPDAFVRSAAVGTLSRPEWREVAKKELANVSAPVRLGALLALRRAGGPAGFERLPALLADADAPARVLALIWGGEKQLTSLTNGLAVALSAGPVSPTLLRAHAATMQILGKTGKANAGTNAIDANDRGSTAVTFVDLGESPNQETSIALL